MADIENPKKKKFDLDSIIIKSATNPCVYAYTAGLLSALALESISRGNYFGAAGTAAFLGVSIRMAHLYSKKDYSRNEEPKQ